MCRHEERCDHADQDAANNGYVAHALQEGKAFSRLSFSLMLKAET
jgi:hypothetical protein